MTGSMPTNEAHIVQCLPMIHDADMSGQRGALDTRQPNRLVLRRISQIKDDAIMIKAEFRTHATRYCEFCAHPVNVSDNKRRCRSRELCRRVNPAGTQLNTERHSYVEHQRDISARFRAGSGGPAAAAQSEHSEDGKCGRGFGPSGGQRDRGRDPPGRGQG
jgi:hypothetical protein